MHQDTVMQAQSRLKNLFYTSEDFTASSASTLFFISTFSIVTPEIASSYLAS